MKYYLLKYKERTYQESTDTVHSLGIIPANSIEIACGLAKEILNYSFCHEFHSETYISEENKKCYLLTHNEFDIIFFLTPIADLTNKEDLDKIF